MLEFLVAPLRSVLGAAEHEVAKPLELPERELVEAAGAIRRATQAIEHHVEVIEGLATSIGPLTDSVDRLTRTVAELGLVLSPVEKAEREVGRIEQLVHLHRREHEPGPPDR